MTDYQRGSISLSRDLDQICAACRIFSSQVGNRRIIIKSGEAYFFLPGRFQRIYKLPDAFACSAIREIELLRLLLSVGSRRRPPLWQVNFLGFFGMCGVCGWMAGGFCCNPRRLGITWKSTSVKGLWKKYVLTFFGIMCVWELLCVRVNAFEGRCKFKNPNGSRPTAESIYLKQKSENVVYNFSEPWPKILIMF